MVYFTPILGNPTNIMKLVLTTNNFGQYHFVHPSLNNLQAIIHMLAGDTWNGYNDFNYSGYSTVPGIFFGEIYSCDGYIGVGSTY